MFECIDNENDLFAMMLKVAYNKNIMNKFYVVEDSNNKISTSVLHAAFKVINKTKNILDISNNIYNIYGINKSYQSKYNIIHNRKIYHKLNIYNIDLIKDKNIYDLSENIHPELYLKDIFNIYNGTIDKNCYIIFTYNDRKFCLSKSLSTIQYKQNEYGKMCLYINNECWEY